MPFDLHRLSRESRLVLLQARYVASQMGSDELKAAHLIVGMRDKAAGIGLISKKVAEISDKLWGGWNSGPRQHPLWLRCPFPATAGMLDSKPSCCDLEMDRTVLMALDAEGLDGRLDNFFELELSELAQIPPRCSRFPPYCQQCGYERHFGPRAMQAPVHDACQDRNVKDHRHRIEHDGQDEGLPAGEIRRGEGNFLRLHQEKFHQGERT